MVFPTDPERFQDYMMQLRGTTSRKDPEGERVAVAKNIRAVFSLLTQLKYVLTK